MSEEDYKEICNDDPIADEQYEAAMREWFEEDDRDREGYVEKFEEYRREMLSNLDPDVYADLFDEEFDPDNYMSICHVGYGTAHEIEYRNGFHPDVRCFKFDHVDYDERFQRVWKSTIDNLTFEEYRLGETDMKYLVWQQVGYCGDDYSGYICYPMKDGRWWICQYEM